MNVVIDTDIFIDFLRGVQPAKSLFEDVPKGGIASYISVMSEAELLSGFLQCQ